MDDQLRERLTRIRDRMTAVASPASGPNTAESYRVLCEVVWAELDEILREPESYPARLPPWAWPPLPE